MEDMTNEQGGKQVEGVYFITTECDRGYLWNSPHWGGGGFKGKRKLGTDK